MKVPKTFIPEKDLEDKIQDLLDTSSIKKYDNDFISKNNIESSISNYLDINDELPYNQILLVSDNNEEDRFDYVYDIIRKVLHKEWLERDTCEGLGGWTFYQNYNRSKIKEIIDFNETIYKTITIIYIDENNLKDLMTRLNLNNRFDKVYLMDIKK